jgi:LuxR family maltose regulon positive regulatory protein
MLRNAFQGGTGSVPGEADADKPGKGLSYRELEVLELFAERLTNKEIAERLSVTAEAVRKRARNIYRKLGVSDRYEAVSQALACGILKNRQ